MSSRSEDAIDSRLRTILKAFDQREEAGNSAASHRKWLATAAGEADAAFLGEHLGRLDPMQKGELSMELARSGKNAALPVVKGALADPKFGPLIFHGLYYACRVSSSPDDKFRRESAESLVPWAKADGSASAKKAIEMLPFLDAEVATKTLMKDEFLAPASPVVYVVISSGNEAGMTFPLPRIHQWLEAWKPAAKGDPQDEQITRLYRQAVIALAVHHPDEAMKLASAAVAGNPDEGEYYQAVPLAAAGLTGLYDRLCDLEDDEEEFKELPEAARIYFAVSYFESDAENGGIGQALGNSTGDLLPLVKKGYAEVGATRNASYLEAMLKPFGPAGPSLDREERVRQMDKMKPDYWEREDELGETWAKEWEDKPRTSISWLMSLYALKHAAELRPLMKE